MGRIGERLSGVATRVGEASSGAPGLVRALANSGLLAPTSPRRLVAAGAAVRHWGVGLAGGVAANAARHPNRPAISDPSGTVSWAELDMRSDAEARALAGIGVKDGSVVGLLCRNHLGFAETTVALGKLGATVLLANTGFAGPQLRDTLAREGAATLVCDPAFTPLVDGAGDLRVVVVDTPGDDTPPPGGVACLGDLAATEPAGRPAAPRSTARVVVLTSGTTGTPKGAGRPQTTGLATGLSILERIPYRHGDTMVVPAPLFHSWGFAHLGLGVLLAGTLVLRPRFDPEETLALIAAHRARVLVAVPVMLARILAVPPEVRRRYDTSSLEVVALSGSALPGGLATAWMDTFGDNLYNLYGSTEVGWASIATPVDLRRDPSTAGRPPRGTTVRILDPDNTEVPTGTTGRIFVGSSLTFDGYTDGRNKQVVDGLMSTGDTGHLNADGLLFVEGRSDEMIVSGGENVFPREVEETIECLDGVVEAAVVGVPDDDFGQRLAALVVVDPAHPHPPAADAVRQGVAATLARFKVPRDVVFTSALPRNPTGKVLRAEVTRIIGRAGDGDGTSPGA